MFIEVSIENRTTEYKLALWTAWHIAAYQRVKRLPNLQRELKRLDPKPREGRTPEELRTMVSELHSMFGGKEKRKGLKNTVNKKRNKQHG